jgi:hypothetical protein
MMFYMNLILGEHVKRRFGAFVGGGWRRENTINIFYTK